MVLTFLSNSFKCSFLTTSFSTTSLNFFKSKGTGFNLSKSSLSTLLFKIFKPLGTLSNSSKSNLSASVFLTNCDVSATAAVFKSDFVA